MNPSVSELLTQGLMITVVGMGLVFAALALLWLLLRVLSSALADKPEPEPAPYMALEEADRADAQAALDAAVALTEERAQVAALVAGAMLSNALPMLFQPPSGPIFEHGRTAPSWVTSNRARALHSWQPPRVTENNRRAD